MRIMPGPTEPAPSSRPGLIQTKLQVSSPRDRHEREADRVAEQLVPRGGPPSNVHGDPACRPAGAPLTPAGPSIVQRLAHLPDLDEEDPEHTLARSAISPAMPPTAVGEIGQAGTTGPTGQHAASGAAPAPATSLSGRLADRRGRGQPLPARFRTEMEGRFGASFRAVRIHADSEAARLTRSVHAHAFTYGRDIYVGAGKYRPDAPDGQRLLAHELTHVRQQREGVGRIDRKVVNYNGRPYTFKSDAQNRPTFAGGQIDYVKGGRKATMKVPNKRVTDVSAHLIAHSLGGPPSERLNYVAMDSQINSHGGTWGRMEFYIRQRVKKKGSWGMMLAQPLYPTAAMKRPDRIVVDAAFNRKPKRKHWVINTP